MKTAKQILVEYIHETSIRDRSDESVEEIASKIDEGIEEGIDPTIPMQRYADQVRANEEQEFLDKCAIAAMNGAIAHYGFEGTDVYLSEKSQLVAQAMLKARKEIQND